MKKVVAFICVTLLVLTCVLSLVGCGAKDTDKGSIKVGVIVEKSGGLSSWGQQDLQGILCGFDYFTNATNKINGYTLEYIVEDTAGDTATAVNKAMKLIEDDGVSFIIGTVSSGVAASVMSIAKEYKVPYLITCAASDAITGANFNEYTFRFGRTMSMASLSGMRCVDNMQGSKWAVFGPDTEAGKSGNTALKTTLEKLGANVVYYEYAPADCQDFSAYAAKIKASNAAFLACTLTGENYTIILPRQLKEAGVLQNTKMIVSVVDFATIDSLGDDGIGRIGECIYNYNLYDNKYNTALIDTHKKLYGTMPDYMAGESFTAAHAAVLALEKITKEGKEINATNIIAALEGLKFEDIKGEVEVRARDHQLLQGMPVAEIIKGTDGKNTVKLYRWVPASEITPEVTAPGR